MPREKEPNLSSVDQPHFVELAIEAGRQAVYSSLDFTVYDRMPQQDGPFTAVVLTEELLATLRVGDTLIVPQKELSPKNDTIFRFGAVRIDTGARTVEVFGDPIHTSPKEFDILTYLVKAHGRVRTRQQIAHAVWKNKEFPRELRTIDVYIFRLNNSVRKQELPALIESVNMKGYKCVPLGF